MQSQNVIKFKTQGKDQRKFFSTLNKKINQYFKDQDLSKKANAEMITKSIIFIGSYIGAFLAILLAQPPMWLNLVLWGIMGFSLAGIGMSVMHDAIHGAYSQKSWVNRMMGLSLNLVGGSTINWHWQHNFLHHTYTNIHDWDEDIEDKGTLKFSPHSKVKWFHRAQWIYAFFFYGLLTLYWVVGKDFVQFAKYTRNGVNDNPPLKSTLIFLRILALKFVYFFAMLVMPTLVFNIPFAYIITGFLLMHFISGIILTVVFQLAHTVEGTEHPLPDEEGNINNAWAIHQMRTTINFATDNRFINWYVGGLNFQIEHHLFPHICHVHYPKIKPIVKETAEEFNVPYQENDTFSSAVKSHLNLLHLYGRLPSMNDAIV